MTQEALRQDPLRERGERLYLNDPSAVHAMSPVWSRGWGRRVRSRVTISPLVLLALLLASPLAMARPRLHGLHQHAQQGGGAQGDDYGRLAKELECLHLLKQETMNLDE